MRNLRQRTKFKKPLAITSIKIFFGKPFKRNINSILFVRSILAVGLALSFSFARINASSAQGGPAFIRQLRALESDKTRLRSPAGLAFSAHANGFYVLEQAGQSQAAVTDIIQLTRFARWGGSARIAAQVKNPINVTFDNKYQRLLILKFPENQLLVLPEKPDGSLDTTAITRTNLKSLGLQDPQGMTVDPTSGDLFILDAAGPQIVRLKPASDGAFEGSLIFKIKIQMSGLVNPRGLAFDPATAHLHLVNPAEQRLYELTQTGKLAAYRDLSAFHLGNPQGMVMAPSGDQTDNPTQLNLYLADSSPASGLLEFSLVQPAPVAAEAASYTSSLIQTVNLANISPPSPDPDGLAYLPLSNRLMMSDSEVDETVSGKTHFAGANVWEMTLSGSVIRTANISPEEPTDVPMSDEPTGVAWNSLNGHYYFSDDNAVAVWDLNPGADGLVGTADDSWTNFDTSSAGSGDPEGIAYDSINNRLFVADGDNREIYQFTTTGTLVNHFDVAVHSVQDPEGVEFNPDSGTLFVLSSDANHLIVETSLTGALIQTIDASASNAVAPAGIAFAPASDGSDAKHFYIVARGIDNNDDPNIIDGKLYEMSSPYSGTPRKPTTTTITSNSPNPSVVGQTVAINYSVIATPPGTGTPTGNVTVSDGTQNCTAAISAGTCSITFATAGAKSLTATYAGDTNFSGSTSSPAAAHTVNKASTTTTITSDLPDPSVVGQSVTINYNVAVATPGSGTPTGNVIVSDGAQSCTGTIAAGSCSITFTTAGAKTLTASYAGDANFTGSAPSPATAHTVNKANTTTSITSDTPDPSVVGQAVIISYSVTVNASGSGTPTGNVTVSDGALSCTGTVAAGSCSITFTSLGVKSLIATYSGDANFNGSASSPPTTHSVKASTTTSITSDLPDPSVVGEPVPINFTVAAVPPESGTPTGNVTVSGGSQSCTATVSAGTCSIAFTTAGMKSLTATYEGDSNFAGSTSSPATAHTVNKANTTTTISSDLPDPSVVGQSVTISYSVTVAAPGSGTPTGTVTVSDGAKSCSGTIAAGSCSITFTTAGAKTLTATYAGDANFTGSASSPATDHTVNKADTSTSITSDSPDPSMVGQAVTINYSVAVSSPGSGTPTGNVTVSDGSDSCTGTVAAGNCSITFTSVGAKTLTATYSGDANYNTSSATASHAVRAATTTTITSDLPDPSVVGQPVTINYSVTMTPPGSDTPTGNVIISAGTQNCSGTVAAGSCSITFTSPGTKSLTATYEGDTNFISSTSSPATAHTVNKADTTTAITNASTLSMDTVVGQPVTINFSVTVTPQGSGTPTGNVTVSAGSSSCSSTVAAGSCSITFTTPGTKNLTATYAGDTNFITSTSATENHTVNAAATTTTISSDLPDPSVVGQTVTINYSVAVSSPGGGTPTGNVTVSDGTDSCTGTVAGGSCSITFTTSGAKTLTATYAGNTNFNTSDSATASHIVNPAATTTVITSDLPEPSFVGQPVTINYRVTVNAPGGGSLTGDVMVSDGSQSCTGTVAAGSCSITFDTAGAKSLTATYVGNVNYSSSTSSPATAHAVNKAGTTTTITSDLPDPSPVGQAVIINYEVAVIAPGSGTPTGDVTISDGIQSCTGTVAAGSCSIAFTSVGVKTLTASYHGDGNFGSSTSATESHAVRAATTTAITSDLPDPSLVGQAVTINYKVTVTSPGGGTPTGNVTISDGIQSCTGSVAAGSCSIVFTTPGIKTLTATYAGDGNNSGSTSLAIQHTVINRIYLPLLHR